MQSSRTEKIHLRLMKPATTIIFIKQQNSCWEGLHFYLPYLTTGLCYFTIWEKPSSLFMQRNPVMQIPPSQLAWKESFSQVIRCRFWFLKQWVLIALNNATDTKSDPSLSFSVFHTATTKRDVHRQQASMRMFCLISS